MTRIDSKLYLNSRTQDRVYSADQVAAVLDGNLQGGGGGGGGSDTILRTEQEATYVTTTINPTGVFYTALSTKDNSILQERTSLGVNLLLQGPNYSMYGYTQPLLDGMLDWLAIWDEGDPNIFSASWETVGGPKGLGTVGTGGANAQFTITQWKSSLVHVDARASTGIVYAWELDGISRPEATAEVSWGPLTIGAHTIKLTVTDITDGSTDTQTKTTNVAWIGEPLSNAQTDSANSTTGSGLDLDKWDSTIIQKIGPWRAIRVLNETDPDGDGDARLIDEGDGTFSVMVRETDFPANAGTLAGWDLSDSYNGTSAGYPAAVANIDPCGNTAAGDGTSGATRFYRVEFLIKATNADATTPPDPLVGQNNVFQLKAASASGDAIVNIGFNGSGTNHEVHFNALPNGATFVTSKIFDQHALSFDTWHNYVIEVKFSLDDTIGYVRVYKDGVATASTTGGLDAQGRFFAVTQQTDANGDAVNVSMRLWNYRQRAYMLAHPGEDDVTVQYRNIRVGPTMTSVNQTIVVPDNDTGGGTGTPPVTIPYPLTILDFDTGDGSQWTDIQAAVYPGYSLTFDNSRTRHGSGYSGRVEIHPGDDPIAQGLGRDRVDLVYNTPLMDEGTEIYAGWSTYFDSALYKPADTAATNLINTIMDFHENRGAGSIFSSTAAIPPLTLDVNTNDFAYPDYQFKLRVAGGPLDSPNGFPLSGAHKFDMGAIVWDAWTDFVVHCFFSVDDAFGLTEVWVNGVKVVTYNGANLYPGRQNYFKQAHYRTSTADDSVLWHDQTKLGPTYVSVDPSTP